VITKDFGKLVGIQREKKQLFLQAISKPICSVILNQAKDLNLLVIYDHSLRLALSSQVLK
jgi:hypothetical protein